MSKNIEQIFTDNPAATMNNSDLMYLGRAPYAPSNDMAITWADMEGSITSVGTITSGTWQGTVLDVFHGGTGVANSVGSITFSHDITFFGDFHYSEAVTNSILWADSPGNVSGLGTGNNCILLTSGAGVPSFQPTLPIPVQDDITHVGVLTSGTWNAGIIGGAYGGTGINNGINTITIGGNVQFSGSFPFNGTLTGSTSVTFPTSGTLATTSQAPVVIDQTTSFALLQALPFISYITDFSGLVTYQLPSSATIGTIIKITGKSSSGWVISQSAGQQILFGGLSTTVGITGNLLSTSATDCVELQNTTPDMVWTVTSVIGNPNVV